MGEFKKLTKAGNGKLTEEAFLADLEATAHHEKAAITVAAKDEHSEDAWTDYDEGIHNGVAPDELEAEWKSMDVDKDGKFTFEEFKRSTMMGMDMMAAPNIPDGPEGPHKPTPTDTQMMRHQFNELDHQKKGFITKQEMFWFASPTAFSHADKNKDKFVDEAEFGKDPFYRFAFSIDKSDKAGLHAAFQKIDANSDGRIDPREHEAVVPGPHGMTDDGGAPFDPSMPDPDPADEPPTDDDMHPDPPH